MLPDGDGFALCAEIRRAGIWTPVLMLTARDAVTDRVRGLDVGADDYLVKPFAFAELTARLRALVRRGAPERPTTLTAGALTIDPAARAVEVDGRPLSLSPREYGLLWLSRPARGRRADTDRDHRACLGLGLRRDLERRGRVRRIPARELAAHPSAPRIETARGVGYVLRVVDSGAPPRTPRRQRGRRERRSGPADQA